MRKGGTTAPPSSDSAAHRDAGRIGQPSHATMRFRGRRRGSRARDALRCRANRSGRSGSGQLRPAFGRLRSSRIGESRTIDVRRTGCISGLVLTYKYATDARNCGPCGRQRPASAAGRAPADTPDEATTTRAPPGAMDRVVRAIYLPPGVGTGPRRQADRSRQRATSAPDGKGCPRPSLP